jgi:hypothetical protein
MSAASGTAVVVGVSAMSVDRRAKPKRPLNLLVILSLIAAMAMSIGACGGDDDESTTGADAGGETAAPPPDDAFRGLATTLGDESIEVTPLPETSLKGAESGVGITGAKQGSARLFATTAEAQDYADEVTKNGTKTTVLGALVFQAASQDDADFFADAYE